MHAATRCRPTIPCSGPTARPPLERFDLITCSEVLEHLHNPLATLEDMAAVLRPGGTIVIMTGWPPAAADFHRWHYRRDPTHVAFYGPATLHWVAMHLGWAIELPATDIALLCPPSGRGGTDHTKNEKPAAKTGLLRHPSTTPVKLLLSHHALSFPP